MRGGLSTLFLLLALPFYATSAFSLSRTVSSSSSYTTAAYSSYFSPQTTTTTVIMCTTTSAAGVLNRVTPENVSLEIKDPVDPTALGQAKKILEELMNNRGSVHPESLLNVAKRLGDVPLDATEYLVSKEACKAAYEALTDQERRALTNIHGRVKAFAEMQRKSVVDMEMEIPGGKAGHTVSPCKGA